MKDILVDVNNDNDLIIQGGDFKIGESDQQHIAHIILAQPGEYKQWPLIGFGIRNYVNGIIDASAKRKLKLQLKSDGYGIGDISFINDKLTVKL